MSTRVLRILCMFVFLSTLGLSLAAPAAAALAEKTLSPYFFIENGEEGVDRLPLKATEVAVTINAVIAQVKVTQHYANEGTRPIHARYVFPASTRAAVHGMRMQVGEQVVVARIQERQAATRTFQAAKQGGKSASLLTEERPNVFTMQVANILPGDSASTISPRSGWTCGSISPTAGAGSSSTRFIQRMTAPTSASGAMWP